MSDYRSLLDNYADAIAPTDMLPTDDLHPVLLGLFGEVGSLMAVAKKQYREPEVYSEYNSASAEEFGDILWYFITLCRRVGADASTMFHNKAGTSEVIAGHPLTSLGKSAAALLDIDSSKELYFSVLSNFADNYLRAIQAWKIDLPQLLEENKKKVCGRFIDTDTSLLPTFDEQFPGEERLPLHFEIEFMQRKSGQSHMRWNGVFIGKPLLDNIAEKDGYRFHDVFHLAHAAILHWSPTFRALIQHKRKSDPSIDEIQDGGRAIVIEEGLTAWIFSRAKQLRLFEGQPSVSFDMLKTVQQFVRGYEAEQCPLKLWERAILQGYAVFREVLHNEGGIVIGDRETRSVTYRAA